MSGCSGHCPSVSLSSGDRQLPTSECWSSLSHWNQKLTFAERNLNHIHFQEGEAVLKAKVQPPPPGHVPTLWAGGVILGNGIGTSGRPCPYHTTTKVLCPEGPSHDSSPAVGEERRFASSCFLSCTLVAIAGLQHLLVFLISPQVKSCGKKVWCGVFLPILVESHCRIDFRFLCASTKALCSE